MSRKFQVKAVPSSWIEHNGRRLDCGPYVSGAIEAKELLSKMSTTPLVELTAGYKGGVYNGSPFIRNFVDDPAHGVPFLTTSSLLHADLSNLSLLSKQDALSRQLSFLEVKPGMTLITCSGSIGKMAFARADMEGVWSNQDILKVVPNAALIKPGYLYAYLSSRFGIPMITSGTYGAIIQHIEPQHISDLPVPRLGDVEVKVHELVQRAADLRTQASQLISEQVQTLEEEISGGPIDWEHTKPQAFSIETRSIDGFANRLDAFHYIGFVGEAIKKAKVPLVEISQHADALYPPFMKRIRVEEGGIEFLGGTEMLTLDQKSDSHIAASTRNLDQFIVKEGYVLFQCDGQRYGIFGRPVLANRNIIGKAVTQHMMRIIPHDKSDAGYIFTYLATGFGRRLLMRFSAGTSIPSLNEDGARKILIYWPDEERRRSISQIAEQAWENRAAATELEDQARGLVERAIEEGGH